MKKLTINKLAFVMLAILVQSACMFKPEQDKRIRVIIDTDANNELDDQHALAYLFFNDSIFDVEGVTVNATRNGGDIKAHYSEAENVIKLCGLEEKIPLLAGADGSFEDIMPDLLQEDYDGRDAVNFIISQAKKPSKRKLVLLPVGKITNIALALKKDPSIAKNVRIVWLGSNYPLPGEYNLVNDIPALNYVLSQDVHFEMVLVRYGRQTGTDAVRVTREEILEKMPGKGAVIPEPVEGRHGSAFTNFGDYSVNLFENYKMDGDPPSRALYDMAAVAVIKNPSWAEQKEIPAPLYNIEKKIWAEQPENPRKIIIWENFDRDAIIHDFFNIMERYTVK
jgi:purine nucleosidase